MERGELDVSKSVTQHLFIHKSLCISVKRQINPYTWRHYPYSFKCSYNTADGLKEFTVRPGDSCTCLNCFQQSYDIVLHVLFLEATTSQSIVLTESNFSKVYDVLSEVRDMWFNIGIQLHITTVTLKGIEENYRENLYALREVLIKCKGTELKDLIEALRKPTIDQPVCAKRLEDLVKELERDESMFC